jgi:hypothetical protein
MNEINLREYVVRYRRKKYIQNTKFTWIQKVRAGLHTNNTALNINKEADRIHIRDTHRRSCFSNNAQIHPRYVVSARVSVIMLEVVTHLSSWFDSAI